MSEAEREAGEAAASADAAESAGVQEAADVAESAGAQESPDAQDDGAQDDEEQPLSDEERKLGRWIAIGVTAMLLGSMGGVLIELIFS